MKLERKHCMHLFDVEIVDSIKGHAEMFDNNL